MDLKVKKSERKQVIISFRLLIYLPFLKKKENDIKLFEMRSMRWVDNVCQIKEVPPNVNGTSCA